MRFTAGVARIVRKVMKSSMPLVEFRTIRGEPYVICRRFNPAPMRFLSLCLDNYFCLSQIAQLLDVSMTTLRKAFSEYAGISPKIWIIQQRVILSIRLIREGVSLSQVANEMAYTDYRHMSKEFRSVVDNTPKSMMKLLRGLQVAAT